VSDATLELHDVTTLTNIALLFAFESLKQMSDTALQQGHAKASQLYQEKLRRWRRKSTAGNCRGRTPDSRRSTRTFSPQSDS
jgi:hypothetical protein